MGIMLKKILAIFKIANFNKNLSGLIIMSEEKFVCKTCGMPFKTKEELEKHKKETHM